MDFNIILFDDFESLDVFGPVEVIGKLEKHYTIRYFSQSGGLIKSSQNAKVETLPLSEITSYDALLIPGGMGTRREVANGQLIDRLREIAEKTTFVLTVCTGSGLLAKAGLLKGRRATSNKRAFDWAASQDADVNWIKKSRWVADGKYYTSSGVSAGIDMTLGFVADRFGLATAESITAGIEYIWNRDKDFDPFCGK